MTRSATARPSRALLEEWQERDPIARFDRYLTAQVIWLEQVDVGRRLERAARERVEVVVRAALDCALARRGRGSASEVYA